MVSQEKETSDENGRIYHSFETANGSEEDFIRVGALFEKDEIGYSKNISINESGVGKDTELYYQDEKGDITVSVYETVK